MADTATKLPVKQETKASPISVWQPFDTLRQEVDRIFEDFTRGFGRLPLGRRQLDIEPLTRLGGPAAFAAPAIDVVENEKEYVISAELPGLDEKDVEINVSDDMLTIRGEKKEEKEEKAKNYYLSERRYGSFQRSFQLPTGVDSEKIEASFQKGVLTVTLPKTPEAQNKERKIAIAAK